jgi:uncharacterized protein YecE (DUF72 family)
MKDDKKIIFGTSGYHFPDWKSNFYPIDIPASLWLKYYLGIFNALELNTTFYAIPTPDKLAKIAQSLPKNFDLHVKIPQSITHETFEEHKIIADFGRLDIALQNFDRTAVNVGYIAQFPMSFTPSEPTIKRLEIIFDTCPKPLFVEFRNKLWIEEGYDEFLSKHEIGWVIPDAPEISNLAQMKPVVTTDTAYIRLHGRNKKRWFEGGDVRYDYNYSNNELGEIFNFAKLLFSKGAKKTFLYFNNCHHGQAAINAKKFGELIGALHAELRLI